MEAHQQDDKAEKEGLLSGAVNILSGLNTATDLYEKGKELYDHYYPKIAQIKDLPEKAAKEALSNIRDLIELNNNLKEEMTKE